MHLSILTTLTLIVPIIFIARMIFVTRSKNTVSRYEIETGRYCFNCGYLILNDEEYYKSWANQIHASGKLDFPEGKACLCKSCERERKLSSITQKIPSKISFKKFMLKYDKKLSISVVVIFALIFGAQITCLLLKFHPDTITAVSNVYLIFYWSFWLLRDIIFNFKKV